MPQRGGRETERESFSDVCELVCGLRTPTIVLEEVAASGGVCTCGRLLSARICKVYLPNFHDFLRPHSAQPRHDSRLAYVSDARCIRRSPHFFHAATLLIVVPLRTHLQLSETSIASIVPMIPASLCPSSFVFEI